MKKIYCNGCQYNFATESMFVDHRTGAFSEGNGPWPVGTCPRRCMTRDELTAMGWELHTLDVDVRIEEKKTKVPMPTWVLPGQLEARERQAQHMREIGFRKSQNKRVYPS